MLITPPWQLKDRTAEVFSQPPQIEGQAKHFVFINYSDRMVLVLNHAFTNEDRAHSLAERINEATQINVDNWIRCKPNTPDRNNPNFPAYREYDFTNEENGNG